MNRYRVISFLGPIYFRAHKPLVLISGSASLDPRHRADMIPAERGIPGKMQEAAAGR
ncbi:MAG: hypothetical protein RHS_5208 [Robinsoniella sp. RHS]|nr:MAG: hypothetical protein RHS_5208 [Robinsoniella sp. RHS]